MRQYDELIARLRTHPLLAASERALFVAFVACDGQPSVQQGAPLYGCHVVLALCERAGRVTAYLPREHQQSHPVYGRQLALVSVQLSPALFFQGPLDAQSEAAHRRRDAQIGSVHELSATLQRGLLEIRIDQRPVLPGQPPGHVESRRRALARSCSEAAGDAHAREAAEL